MTEIMMTAYDLLDEFKNLSAYQQLKTLDETIHRMYKIEVLAFENAKKAYQDVMAQGGAYHPDFKTVVKTLSEKKKELYEKKEVEQFLKLEQKVQALLNDMMAQIKDIVSPYMKTPNEIGVISKGGHHGCK